jgi:hypothetical protein
MRPAPGDRGAWSHGPIARVYTRPAAPSSSPAHPSDPTPATPAAAPDRRQPPPPYPRGGGRFPVSARGLTPLPPRPTTAAALVPRPPARNGFGLPSLRRNVCPHFYMTGSRGAIPIQAPHLLKGLLRQPSNISRCQLRGGVHLDEGYVNDVCLTPRFNQCVFYEDELTRE